jgi:hypothetical protein
MPFTHCAGTSIGCAVQESELEAAKWMPLHEYVQQTFQKGVPLYDQMRRL